MYEICREYNGEEWDGFEIDDEIVMALEDLAAGVAVGGGSVKESAKKERKAQRTSFRHILVFSKYFFISVWLIFRNSFATMKIHQSLLLLYLDNDLSLITFATSINMR